VCFNNRLSLCSYEQQCLCNELVKMSSWRSAAVMDNATISCFTLPSSSSWSLDNVTWAADANRCLATPAHSESLSYVSCQFTSSQLRYQPHVALVYSFDNLSAGRKADHLAASFRQDILIKCRLKHAFRQVPPRLNLVNPQTPLLIHYDT